MKDLINNRYLSWYFYNAGYSKVPRYFKSVAESGIQSRLRKEEFQQIFLDRLPVKKVGKEDSVKPIKLDGAISTLFILYGTTIIGALLAFSLENCYSFYISMRHVVTSVGGLIQKLFTPA